MHCKILTIIIIKVKISTYFNITAVVGVGCKIFSLFIFQTGVYCVQLMKRFEILYGNSVMTHFKCIYEILFTSEGGRVLALSLSDLYR